MAVVLVFWDSYRFEQRTERKHEFGLLLLTHRSSHLDYNEEHSLTITDLESLPSIMCEHTWMFPHIVQNNYSNYLGILLDLRIKMLLEDPSYDRKFFIFVMTLKKNHPTNDTLTSRTCRSISGEQTFSDRCLNLWIMRSKRIRSKRQRIMGNEVDHGSLLRK
jgi:hypothetical protein